MHRLQELVRLHRLRLPVRQIADELGIGPNTERDYRRIFDDAGLLVGDPDVLPDLEELRAIVDKARPKATPKQETSSVAKWQERIEALRKGGAKPKAIFDCLGRENKDFQGSYNAVKRLCRRLEELAGPTADDVVIPIDAPLGEAQIDFGYLGHLYDPAAGRLRKAWVFVMVLAHSRQLVARIAFDQAVDTWLRLHVEAFEELGGVPSVWVPDNLKAAVIRAAFGADEHAELNRSYRELARHYGARIDPTPPRSPEKKGRVESAVKYIKSSWLSTLGVDDRAVDRARASLQVWVAETANARLHGTTRRRPDEIFAAEERSALLPLPAQRYQPVIWKRALVHRDAHLEFLRRLYSVPFRFIGKQVWVRADPESVVVYHEDVRIAAHARRGPGSRSTQQGHLPEERAEYGNRCRPHWEERAAAIGPEVADFIARVFDQDDVLSMLRTVQSIVTHLEKFPRERAIAACRRAAFYDAFRLQTVKQILRDGLDLQPLPIAMLADDEAAAGAAAGTSYRFARNLRDLIQQPLETTHEPQ
ncbi:MAG TPA: IS21 family transposase [Nannocystaceae bacterium]|nr:IS21 family transposase [Nannocystaceae bacterium]